MNDQITLSPPNSPSLRPNLKSTLDQEIAKRNNVQTTYMIKKLGYDNKIIEFPQAIVPEKESYCLLISQHSELATHLKEINDELRKMHTDGTLSRIRNKYLRKIEMQ